MGMHAALAVGAAALVLAGCAEQPTRSAEMSRTEWQNGTNNGPWPFTVAMGVLTCHPPDWVTLIANGTEYALTDDARWLGHYQDVKAILIESYVQINAERQPIPVAFSPTMTDRGRDLCPPGDSGR